MEYTIVTGEHHIRHKTETSPAKISIKIFTYVSTLSSICVWLTKWLTLWAQCQPWLRGGTFSVRNVLGCQPLSQSSRNWNVSSFRPLVLLVRVLVRKNEQDALLEWRWQGTAKVFGGNNLPVRIYRPQTAHSGYRVKPENPWWQAGDWARFLLWGRIASLYNIFFLSFCCFLVRLLSPHSLSLSRVTGVPVH